MSSNLYSTFKASIEYVADLKPELFRNTIVKPLAKAIIDKNIDRSNLLIETITFNFHILIFLTSDDPFHEHDGFIQRLKLKHNNFQQPVMASFTLGHSKSGGKRLVMVAQEKDYKIPITAWRLITSPLEKLAIVTDARMSMADEVLKLISSPEGIDISDKRLSNGLNDYAVERSLRAMINHLYANDFGLDQPTRVLDEEACKQLLELIQEERKTHDWINSIVAKK